MCDYCSDLRPTVRIRVPKKLSQMLLRASDRLADGTLIDITPAYDKVYGHSLDFAKTIANSGYITHTDSQGNRDIYGWNDFVVHYFQCTHCNAVFRLDAETYHGSGGQWEMLEEATIRYENS